MFVISYNTDSVNYFSQKTILKSFSNFVVFGTTVILAGLDSRNSLNVIISS